MAHRNRAKGIAWLALGISVISLVATGLLYSQTVTDAEEQIQTAIEETTAELEAELSDIRDQLEATNNTQQEEAATTSTSTQ